MADVELVIKIPEESYKILKNEGVDWLGAEHILNAVANGKLLPKGHGDLKDEDNLKISFVKWNMVVQDCFNYSDIATIVHHSPTIIEANKEDK